ncbi:hypothetical protein ACIP93_33925 [Streptomyces sp. NPDC088745]|uniref:hypothetical protein n=1 Tax=Streptomyces sp. NPDC088745 TaxID=3365884 RepID=UPI003817FC61
MPDSPPPEEGATHSVAGTPVPATAAVRTDAVYVKAECAIILGWTRPPGWPRLLKAAGDLHGFYWGVVNSTDQSRITARLRKDSVGLEHYQTALAKGRELVGDLERTVRGATSEVQALRAVQELAGKVRALAFELDQQQNYASAHRQLERLCAADTAVRERQVPPYPRLSYPHCTGESR